MLLQVVNHPDVIHGKLFPDTDGQSLGSDCNDSSGNGKQVNKVLPTSDWQPVITEKNNRGPLKRKRQNADDQFKNYNWANPLFERLGTQYQKGLVEYSGKMVLLLSIVEER